MSTLPFIARVILPLLSFLVVAPANANAQGDPANTWTFHPNPLVLPTTPPTPQGTPGDLLLVLDDGTAEGTFGFGSTHARQFLWFNHFSPAVPFALEQIWVLFPANENLAPGDAIDLVIYRDTDGDPTVGAQLVAVTPETVRHADGTTFSVYDLNPEIMLDGTDVFLGVIPRYIDSGTSPSSAPATLDTTVSQGRSWVALWNADPPAEPHLLGDNQIHLIDDLVPGNWMIRGTGRQLSSVLEVPTLGNLALITLALALSAAAIIALRRG